MRDAETHLQRAKALDPENAVASAFLEKVLLSRSIPAPLVIDIPLLHVQLPSISRSGRDRQMPESDDEHMEVDASGTRRKRART